jgi:hypothetical protein
VIDAQELKALIEFLELVSIADFAFRYERGDPKTLGIEGRHKILKNWIARLKDDRRRPPWD